MSTKREKRQIAILLVCGCYIAVRFMVGLIFNV